MLGWRRIPIDSLWSRLASKLQKVEWPCGQPPQQSCDNDGSSTGDLEKLFLLDHKYSECVEAKWERVLSWFVRTARQANQWVVEQAEDYQQMTSSRPWNRKTERKRREEIWKKWRNKMLSQNISSRTVKSYIKTKWDVHDFRDVWEIMDFWAQVILMI